MKVLLIFFMLVALLSCGERDATVESIDHIIPSSQRDYNKSDEIISSKDTLASLRSLFSKSGIAFTELLGLEEQLFPDRFGADSSDKIILIRGADSLKYCHWYFSDSVKLRTTFFNWMDVFGENGIEMTPGVEAKIQKPAFTLFFGDSSLIYIENNAAPDDWLKLLNADYPKRNWKYIITQRKSGRTKWFAYREGKRITFEQAYENN